MKIRRAKIEDLEKLAELAYKTYWDTFHSHPENDPVDFAVYMKSAFNIEKIRSELKDKNSIFLVTETGREMAGYAKLEVGSNKSLIKAKKPIELNRLYAKQEFIGKGIGQQLMDECFEIAGGEGCDVIWLGVWELNPRAISFYKKNGFETVGSHIFQMGSDKQTDLLMQKKLG